MLSYIKIVVACIVIIFNCNCALGESKASEHLPRALPAGALHDLDGKEFSLERLEGNVLLIHFWATWCTSCADEIKSLNKLQKLLRKDPIIVIPISEDFKGAETVKAFYSSSNLAHLPAFIDKNNKWFREMRVTSLPATFLIDTQGKNVMLFSGGVDWLNEKTIDLIKKYISDKQQYNQDYVSLLSEYAVDIPKPKARSRNDKSKMLKAIETELTINVEEEKVKRGEINMTNTPQQDPKKRRPVNLDRTN